MKKFSNIIDLSVKEGILIFTNPVTHKVEVIDLSYIQEERILCETHAPNQLIALIPNDIIVYINKNKVIIKKINLESTYLESPLYSVDIHPINGNNVEIFFEKKYIARIYINQKHVINIEDFFKHESRQYISKTTIDDTNLKLRDARQRYINIANIRYNDIALFITYDRFLKEVIIRKEQFVIRYKNKNLDIQLVNVNNIKVVNKATNDTEIINVNDIEITPKRMRKLRLDKTLKNEHIICYFTFRNKRFYLYNRLNGIFIIRSNPSVVARTRSYLKPFALFKSFYLIGLFKHNGYKAKHMYDNLYLQSIQNPIGKFKRPFRGVKYFNQLVIGRIKFDDVLELNRIHSNLLCGNDKFILHNLELNPFSTSMKTLITRRRKNDLIVLRNNLGSNLTLTTIPFSPEYRVINKFKNFIASKLFKNNNNKKNINLFFEKKSERAEESGSKVFDAVYNRDDINSKNYFILDNKANYFDKKKALYGNNLIKKYSFKHYKYIYKSNYFISSELPNHLINDRLYLDDLREKLMETPSVFLQHGIMFAKPVDNPMAYGFHKQYNKYNNIKNVVSSDMESEQFYKMGYSKKDLIKTGLATFDNAILNEGANKISFMPTYRFWEEKFIYSGNITKTSYFKIIMKIIHAFEDNGLLDRLLIVPHNKFSEYIFENMPQYRNIICSNPSIALRDSQVFITDYSSAIYDSIYRGAYPIFYWEEREYLIENYQAIPPINEYNAPGPVAFNIDDLMDFVKQAIYRDYKLEQKYLTKYKMINEFDDNKNTERIIEELKKINIL